MRCGNGCAARIASARCARHSPQAALTVPAARANVAAMTPRAWLVVLSIVSATANAQETVRFADLVGAWAADPVYGGESSHVALQFLEKDGKLEARMSIPAIAVHDVSLGEVSIAGDSIDTKTLSQPLTWYPSTRTLRGFLTAEAVPVYRIPVEFTRSQPEPKPAPREWKAPAPKVVWSVTTGAAVWAGIERDSRGTLFVGNEAGDLRAIDAAGKVRWTFATGKPIRGQPRAIGPHVYVAADSGFLYKLDRRSGKERWRVRIDGGSEPRIPPNEPKSRWDRYGSSVAGDGQRVFYASRDKNLYALDAETGRERWRVAAGDMMTATPALYEDTVIYAAFDGKVRAVSATDGEPRWTYDAKLAVPGDVVVAGDRVLVGSRSYDLIALDAATGKELWKRYYWFSWIESPPVVFDGVIYTGSSDATNVYAIDLVDGSLRWKTAVPGWSWQRTAVNERWVIAGTAGAGEYPGRRAGSLVALDRATGAIRWLHLEPPSKATIEAKKGWGFGASPVIGDGVVYAADLDGKVHAIELK
jgi:outer membrane protein assembly factor BamB